MPDVVILSFPLRAEARTRGRPVEGRLKGASERNGPLSASARGSIPESSELSTPSGPLAKKARKERAKVEVCSACKQPGHRKTSQKCPKRSASASAFPEPAQEGEEVDLSGLNGRWADGL